MTHKSPWIRFSVWPVSRGAPAASANPWGFCESIGQRKCRRELRRLPGKLVAMMKIAPRRSASATLLANMKPEHVLFGPAARQSGLWMGVDTKKWPQPVRLGWGHLGCPDDAFVQDMQRVPAHFDSSAVI